MTCWEHPEVNKTNKANSNIDPSSESQAGRSHMILVAKPNSIMGRYLSFHAASLPFDCIQGWQLSNGDG